MYVLYDNQKKMKLNLGKDNYLINKLLNVGLYRALLWFNR